jgi:hypothetical protein
MKRNENDEALERFVEVWQSSESLAEAASRLGMPKASVPARAAKYRNQKDAPIPLKKMPRENSLDVEGLNEFILSLATKGDGKSDVEAHQSTDSRSNESGR